MLQATQKRRLSSESSANFLPLLLLMSTITLMAVLCELVPSGVLPAMSHEFGVDEATTGGLVGGYAIASAICGIPLVSLTVSWERKKLLGFLLMGFALSNAIVGVAPSFEMALLGRVLGGMCAGTLWPMITAYGMSIVEEQHQAQAVAIIMSGITVGMSIGLPAITWLGRQSSYRIEFFVLAICLCVICFACYMALPNVAGEKRTRENSPWSLLKNTGVLRVMILTFLAVGANYGTYTFITNLVAEINYPAIEIAQLCFGVGSIISVCITMAIIDTHLFHLVLGAFLLGVLTMAMFVVAHDVLLFHIAFCLWGIAFGSLSTLFQASTARQVTEGVAVANSLQSCSFNFSIMFGSAAAGVLLRQGGCTPILIGAGVILVLGLGVTCMSKSMLSS